MEITQEQFERWAREHANSFEVYPRIPDTVTYSIVVDFPLQQNAASNQDDASIASTKKS